PPRGRRPSGRRRAPNKATPYSTSYDRADDEPFEPGWSGATWYGASSGTYWTINPKEYADPRKHGPEYQRRARRSATGWILDDGDADAATDTEPALDGATDERRDPPNGGDDDRRTRADNPRGRGDRVEQPSWTGGADPDPAPIRTKPPTGRAAPDDDVARGGAALEGRDRPAAPLPPRAGGATLPMPTTPAGRLAFALLGWPPIGLALAAAIGEETGCGRFAASCDALAGPGTWVVQAAIVVLLLAIPSVARWSAHGTLATLIAGVPVAAVLSAGGGSRQPDASAAALGVVLALAYVVGVGYAVWMSRRSRTVAPDAGRDVGRDTPGGDAP
ncbi:MAG TPA: hypothetical protein VFP22_11120, partial [Candidatus Limnocylindrales bacterium]|nr:hypothetical protein [Candidatus Limnocylindrales bacterium]